jgi:hypothetical protein
MLTLEDGTDTLHRNFGDKPTYFTLQQTSPSVLPTTFGMYENKFWKRS